MFELHDVVKAYGEGASAVHAVDGISLRVDSGEFVVIEGPSGSGKSTLLQMLGALDRPTAGSVIFNGRDLATLPDKQLAMLRLRTFGFVFQQFNLVPTLNAVENVESALAPLKGSPRKKRERAMRLLNGVGLGDRADHLPSQLSGGEQQRVAIARALSKGPRVILADEPTGNLDTRTGSEIMAILRRLSQNNGQTVILITHDPEIAATAPRVVRVRDGRVVADASGRELIEAGSALPARPSLPPIAAAVPHHVPEPQVTTQGGTLRAAAEPVETEKWVPTASMPKPASDPLLHAEGVVKHYVSFESHEDVVGIDGVSLIVHEGEFVAITGPSGSGKTTLLNCLSGLDRIDRGRVLIGGHTVHDLSDKEQSHLRSKVMGFIFQNWNLVPVFSAVENVELPLLLNGLRPAEARAAATRTLDRIGLAHRLHHHPNTLSGGEQQRVAIARALAAGPSLVWADEPTGNLDSATAESVMKLLRELNDDGLAVILVTHDESIAEQASRRLFIRDGKLLADMTRRNATPTAPRMDRGPVVPSNVTTETSRAQRRMARRSARMNENPNPQLDLRDPQPRLPDPGRLPDEPISFDDPFA
ncbi:MAG TPA: ATP-binding cassette domain-containing protein [Acidimicrobiales bacterium]|nr:ATP-binding cassette domain-containing protein [Acidimicrobiales bacterium]